MTKSEMIEKIAEEYPSLSKKDIEFIVNGVFSSIKETLKSGGKVEIRGFGSFKVREKAAKLGRRLMYLLKKSHILSQAKRLKSSLYNYNSLKK